jgi:hypothetical protein
MTLSLITAALLEGGLLFWTQLRPSDMWVKLSDADLIAHSEIIVVAELIGQTKLALSPGDAPLTLGVLKVDESFKGSAAGSLVLLVLPTPAPLRPSTDLAYQKGQKGLWFLRARLVGQVGLYMADHPQRFIPSTNSAAIEAMRKTLESPPKKP